MAYEWRTATLVNLLLFLAFAQVEIKNLRCLPYSANGGATFSARGPLDLSTNSATLELELRGEPAFEETYIVTATYNRQLYKMYFLENAASSVPSIVLRISNSQLSPTSNL